MIPRNPEPPDRSPGGAASPPSEPGTPQQRYGRRRLWLGIAAFGLFLLAALLVIDRAAPAGRGVVKISGVDPLAYYSVTHSLLYDGDVDLANQYGVLSSDSYWLAEVPATGRRGSPFPLGYSLFELPFLAAARGIRGLEGLPEDGYSRLSILFYYGGNIVAACLGLAFLLMFLSDIDRWLAGPGRGGGLFGGSGPPLRTPRRIVIVAAAIWTGTTVGYYTLSPMPHVVAFAAMTLFLHLWWRRRDSDEPRHWALVGAVFGFLVLCRWQALLFLIVPLGYDALRAWPADRRFGRWLSSRVVGGLAALAVFTPQMLEWKAIYGAWITIPQGAGFIELPPRYVLHVLLSSYHGWFVWTPLVAVGIAGLLRLVVGGRSAPGTSAPGPSTRERLAIAVPCLLAIGLQVALVGSLPTSWYNRDSFSIRMLTTATPLVAVGLLVLLRGRTGLRRAALTAIGLSVVWSLVSAFQFRLDLVPREDRLTARELVGDKFLLADAWKRRRAADRARRALARGDLGECLRVTRGAVERFGADRPLLLLTEVAQLRSGDPEAAARTRRQIDDLLARRLF